MVKKSLWLVSSLGVFALLLVMGCSAKNVEPGSTPSSGTSDAGTPATIMQTAEPLTKVDTNVGTAPQEGWSWGVAMHENGKHNVTEAIDNHDSGWLFFVTRGQEEIGFADNTTKTIKEDEGLFLRTKVDHTHLYGPRTHVLSVRLGPGAVAPGDYHGGYPGIYYTGKVLETKAGASYNIRTREYVLDAGERRPDMTVAEPNMVFVIGGTLTTRPASGPAVTTGTYKVGELPLNMKLYLGNEGKDPVKFIIVDLHQ